MSNPVLLADRIEVECEYGQVTVWNSITVKQHHDVSAKQIESEHQVLAGDGSTGEKPEFVTPAIAEKYEALGIYPSMRIIDPADEEVTVL